MQIGSYTFEEFKQKAAEFHGYPAPGIMLGGYMVELAKRNLPAGTLFEALVESKKCLPDAVQLLTLCSTGNGWMKVLDLGRYALSLYDKRTGEGFRVGLNPQKLKAYPEFNAWFMKLKPKSEQDSEQLLREIETAGDSVCTLVPVRMHTRLLGKGASSSIGVCPLCNEPYPTSDGLICRGCQGETPFTILQAATTGTTGFVDATDAVSGASGATDHAKANNRNPTNNNIMAPQPFVSVLPVEEAVGKAALHDMTEVIPGLSKGAAFAAGQVISAGDVCRLQQMGRFSVAVAADIPTGFVHENAGAEAFARRMAGANVEYSLPPKEGKVNFRATAKGLFTLNRNKLLAFNLLTDVMCATLRDGTLVNAGAEVAGTRVIPLYISQERFAAALEALDTPDMPDAQSTQSGAGSAFGSGPLFSVVPLRRAKVGILVTGSEVFQGLIEDKFIPIVSAKVERLGCTVVKTVIAPDEITALCQGIEDIRASDADMLITTGGMSVDPGDITRAALMEAGVRDMLYGAPVLPGTMSLVGYLPAPGANDAHNPKHAKTGIPVNATPASNCGLSAGAMQVIGVPACALYHKITLFDALLPRLLAGRKLTRADLARLGEGGFCQNCPNCTWPNCAFL